MKDNPKANAIKKLSRRTIIKSIFQDRARQGKAGTPPEFVRFGKEHRDWEPFITKMDHKYSHRVMKNQLKDK